MEETEDEVEGTLVNFRKLVSSLIASRKIKLDL